MEYTKDGKDIILKAPDSFKISEILECGQCFRFSKLSHEEYVINAYGKLLRVKEEKSDIIFFDTTEEDFKSTWVNYFDLSRDYGEIKDRVSANDLTLKEAVEFAPGIRILKQDFFECLISFIISQNNRIPMIKKVIGNISQRYGSFICEFQGEDYFAFPTPIQLSLADEEGLMGCKTGFRARYIIDAVDKVNSGEIDFSELCGLETADVRKRLMTIKGVGPKVADCVMLFSFGRGEVFPTDVWVKRIMTHFYFGDTETSLREIQIKADSNFGVYAGFAQQYLFNFARQLKIGT